MDPGSIFRLITNSTLLATRLLSGQNNNLYFETFHYCTLVFEDAPISSDIIKVTAHHLGGKSILYNIVGGNPDGLFSVNQITGQVSVAASLDHEVKSEHSLIISAEAFDGTSSETKVDIMVADVNDNAPEFEKNSLKVNVVEEERAGLPKTLGRVRATDLDWLDQNNLLYTLIGDGVDGYAPEDAYFTVNPQSGKISQLKPLDRDPPSGKPIWKLKVKVHDGQSNWIQSRIMAAKRLSKKPEAKLINLEHERNLHSMRHVERLEIPPTPVKVTESSILAKKTVMRANRQVSQYADDTGTGNCQLLSSISSPLTASQETRLKQLIPEIISSQKYVPTSKVNVVETEVLVEVEDINDNPPIFPNTTFFAEVQENGPMDLHVAMVTAWDADDPKSMDSRLHYYLEQNAVDERNGAPIFRINPETGEIRTNVCCLDRESTFEYLLQVVATDGGGLKGTGAVAVRLSDVNDNSPRFARPEWQVIIDETQDADVVDNATLFEIAVSDPDTLNNFLFRVVESSGWGWQFFGIRTAGFKGEVYAKKPLDYEDDRQREGFRFLVEVTDQGSWNEVRNRESTWIVVKLRDVNDNAPVFQQTLLHVTIREDIKPYTLIARVAAVDPDQSGKDHIEYSLMDNWGNLNINKIGEIRTQSLIDREGYFGSRGFVRILAVDSGVPPRSSTATLEIEVLDVNDCAPRLVGNAIFHVPENIQPSRVGILFATDDDLWGLGHGPPFTFELDPSNTPFAFENFNLQFMQEIDSGRGGAVLSTRKILDREEQRIVVLKVSVNDAGNLVSYHDVTVIVDDVNDNDMNPSSKIVYLWKAQTIGVESSIGRVYVDDPDDWDFADKTFDWAESPHPLFTLNQSTGDIKVSSHIREGRYNLRFKVSDLHRGQRDVPANVTVQVRFTDVASFSHAVAITLSPITSFALTQNWIPFTDDGKLGKLTWLIRTVSSYEVREVEVVSIEEDNIGVGGLGIESTSTSVWLVAKDERGHYLDSTKFRGLIEMHKRRVETLLNLKVNFKEMSYVDLPETSSFSDVRQSNSSSSPFALSSSSSLSSVVSYLPLHSSSSSPLLYYSKRHQSLFSDFVTLQDIPLQVIDSNKTSLVTPQITRQFFCPRGTHQDHYGAGWKGHHWPPNFSNIFQCSPSTCFNGGKCVPSEYGSRCICPSSTWGRHCKVVTRSFMGNGFAWFDPLPPCYPLKISLNILLGGAPDGMIIYSGPLSNKTSETSQRNLHPDKPTGLLALQIKREKFQLILEADFGSSILELEAKNVSTWNTIHIYVNFEEAYLMTDGCSKYWDKDRISSSHCLSHVRWKRKSTLEKYPWKVPWQMSLPLQIGGLAHEIPSKESHRWKYELTKHSLVGCISKLRINEQIIDFGEPSLSHGTERGCQMKQNPLCYSESCLPLQYCKKTENGTTDDKCNCLNIQLNMNQVCNLNSTSITLSNLSNLRASAASSSNSRIAVFHMKIKTRRKSISLLKLVSESRNYFIHLHIKNGITCLDYYNKPFLKVREEIFQYSASPTTRNLTIPSLYQKEIPKNKIQWKIKELNNHLRENIKPQLNPQSSEVNDEHGNHVNGSVCLVSRFLSDGQWHHLRGGRYGLNLELEVDDGDAAVGERNESLGFLNEKLSRINFNPKPFQLMEGENCVVGGSNSMEERSDGQQFGEDSKLCVADLTINGEFVELSKVNNIITKKIKSANVETNFRSGCHLAEQCEPSRSCDENELNCIEAISNCSCQKGSTPTSTGCTKYSICDYNPCLHEGTCIPQLKTKEPFARCVCPPSFVGYYCEFEWKKEAQEKAFFAAILALLVASCILLIAAIGSLIWKYISSKRSQRINYDNTAEDNVRDNQLKAYREDQNIPPDKSELPQIVETTSTIRQKSSSQVPNVSSIRLKPFKQINVLALVIDDSLSKISNENASGSHLEDLRSYAYEGDGSSSGSLGSALSDLREEFHDSNEILPLNPITKDVVDLLKDLPDGCTSTLQKKKGNVKQENNKNVQNKISLSEEILATPKVEQMNSFPKKQKIDLNVLLTNNVCERPFLHM